MPPITVIIPTLNRGQFLRQTVGLLLAEQSFRDFELIVVDQGAEQDVEFENLFQRDARLRYFHVSFQSLTKARNFGVARSHGEIILFSDDDVIPSANLLSTYFEHFATSNCYGAAGPVLAPGQRLRKIDELSELERSRLEPKRYLACFDADFPHSVVFASGANCAFRKSAILEVGGFDEAYTGNAWGEDYEFCYRLRKRFGSIEYLPGASVIHLTVPTGECRDWRNGKYVRSFCRNSIYTKFRIKAGFAETSAECWRMVRVFVVHGRALRRPRPHWLWHIVLGCFDGYMASRLPRKLPLAPAEPIAAADRCVERGARAI